MYFYKQNVLCGHFFLSHVLVQNKTKRKKNNHINSVLDSVLVQKLNAPAGYGAVCVCVCVVPTSTAYCIWHVMNITAGISANLLIFLTYLQKY